MADKDCPPATEVVIRQTVLFTRLLDDGRNARKVGMRDTRKQMVLNMKIQTTAEEIPKLGIVAPIGGWTNHGFRPIAGADVVLIDMGVMAGQEQTAQITKNIKKNIEVF